MRLGLVTAFVGNVMRSSGNIRLVGVGRIINEGGMLVAAIVLLVAYQKRRFLQVREEQRGIPKRGERFRFILVYRSLFSCFWSLR